MSHRLLPLPARLVGRRRRYRRVHRAVREAAALARKHVTAVGHGVVVCVFARRPLDRTVSKDIRRRACSPDQAAPPLSLELLTLMKLWQRHGRRCRDPLVGCLELRRPATEARREETHQRSLLLLLPAPVVFQGAVQKSSCRDHRGRDDADCEAQ